MPCFDGRSMPPRDPRTAAWLAVMLLVPTLLSLRERSSVRVDRANHAMKSVGTDEARVLARRNAAFGAAATILVAHEKDATLSPDEIARLESAADDLRALEGVDRVVAAPGGDASSRTWIVELASERAEDAELIERVDATARRGLPEAIRARVAGQPIGEVVISREVHAEQRRVVPWIAGGLVALLLIFYRHLGLVAAIVVPAAVGIAWTSGLHAWLGHRLDPVSVMLEPVLLTVGVAAGVHFVEAYLDGLSLARKPWDAAWSAIEELRVPASLAALTTVIGLFSLAFSAIPAVVDFGVFAGVGVALTFALSLLLVPLVLATCARRIDPRFLARRGAVTGAIGERAADWIARRAKWVCSASLALALVGCWAWMRIEVDNDPLDVLPADHAFRRDAEAIGARLGANDAFDVLVPAASRLADVESVGLLAADVLLEPRVASLAGAPAKSQDGDWLVRFLLAPSGSDEREALFDRVERAATAFGAPDARATGNSVQIARDSGRLVRGQLAGVFSSSLLLLVVFWLGLRSFELAALALIPNLLPCIAIYGGLALIGEPLSVATAMISSVLLGLIVDDTIHLLHRYRVARARGENALNAIEHVFRHAGRGVVITSTVLAGGFALAMVGRLSTTFEFGALAATTIVVALLADLLILPALLVVPSETRFARAEACRA